MIYDVVFTYGLGYYYMDLECDTPYPPKGEWTAQNEDTLRKNIEEYAERVLNLPKGLQISFVSVYEKTDAIHFVKRYN